MEDQVEPKKVLTTEMLMSLQFEGYEVIEKTVKASGNSGRVYLPTSWVGTKVKIVRLTPKKIDSEE